MNTRNWGSAENRGEPERIEEGRQSGNGEPKKRATGNGERHDPTQRGKRRANTRTHGRDRWPDHTIPPHTVVWDAPRIDQGYWQCYNCGWFMYPGYVYYYYAC